MADKAGRVVFIGNIPYGLTEEQIVHIFGQVGQVLNFRLVYDNDTGKPKGFGFAEFADQDAAASAVRNLNNYEVMGRELRVDFSHVGGKDDGAPSGYNAQHTQPNPPTSGYQPTVPGGLPPLPPGTDLQPNITCPDAISKTLSTLPAPQLLDILSQMKGLVMGDPAKATELLKQAPQLAYAIFQALLLMGLVDTSVLGSVVEQASHPAQPPAQPPAHSIPPRQVPAYQPPVQQPYPQYSSVPGQMHVPTPPVHNQLYQPPQAAPPPPPPPQQQSVNQEELLQQILNMSQQQIDQLAPADRAQIMAVRQQLRGY